MALAPRVVVVHRRTELDELTARHSTRGQAEFFLKSRAQSIAALDVADEQESKAVQSVGVSIPADWRRADVERSDLPQFLFGPEDIVAVVGRDGLVANVAKYVTTQPVVGFNPHPESNAGVLTRFDPASAPDVLRAVATGRARVTARTMVTARTDDGQSLDALNDLYIGDAGHQSARYDVLTPDAAMVESQSSSGIVVGTGTGATGWLASLAHDRGRTDLLPGVADPRLAWFVREAWPSPFTGASLTAGALVAGQNLQVTVKSESLVVFGDGIEVDALALGHGQRLMVGVAERRLALVEAV